jgi:hypothetical protein
MRIRVVAIIIVICVTSIWAATASAAASPEANCEAGKNKESGEYASCLHDALAKLLKTKGKCSIAATVCYRDEECPITQTCQKDPEKYNRAVTKCENQYAESWNKLEQKATQAGATCPDGLTEVEVKQVIDECVSNVAAGLAGDGLEDCPSDMAECSGELADCDSSLSSTQASLTACNGSLSTCNTNYSTCTGDLSTCNTNYSTCSGDLSTCNTNYATCTADLATSNANYTMCNGDLSTCNTNYTMCTGDLSTCNTNLAIAQACGDGNIDAGEDCDQADLDGGTCVSEGFAGGPLACGTNCGYDTGGCYATRFVDNGDGTISDYETGLMWEKKADLDGPTVNCTSAAVCPNPHDADNHYTWSAVSPNPNGTAYTVFLAQLNGGGGFAGKTDWRLPTRAELQSTVDYADATSPTVNAVFHTGCTGSCTITTCSCIGSSGYWTSSTIAASTSNAFVVGFGQGLVVDDPKTVTNYARAVRTGL